MSHPELSACPYGIDAGAYVLAALSDGEARTFAAHLESCERCRAEVEALAPVVDTLPLAAPVHVPPAAIKHRLMAVVTAEAQLLRAAGPEVERRTADLPRRGWRTRFSPLLRPALAGALACTLLGLGIAGGVLVGGDESLPTRTVAVSAKSGARANLQVTGDRAALQVRDMPSLSKGRVYQVWFDRGDGQVRPTHTLFNVRSDGRARIAIEESIAGVKRILVTAEPSGGSLAPSPGGPLMTADLA